MVDGVLRAAMRSVRAQRERGTVNTNTKRGRKKKLKGVSRFAQGTVSYFNLTESTAKIGTEATYGGKSCTAHNHLHSLAIDSNGIVPHCSFFG